MSCLMATAPIDISLSNITGNCQLKCSYNFNYNNSSCIATNRGDYIKLSYDKSSSPPVSYNAIGYDVEEIRIYTPSLHSYSDIKTEGELVIVHSSNTGAVPLLVCIPIKANNIANVSSLFLKTVIDTVADSAPSDGESTTVNILKYNLTALVPKKPFFSYSATEPYQPCGSSVDYIVFAPLDASLDIMQETLTKLQSMIQSHAYDIKSGPNLFFNEKGPGTASGNDIYIDCQPVGTSSDSSEVIVDIAGTTTINDFFKNPLVQLFSASIVFIVILYVTKMLLNGFQSTHGE